MFLQNQKSSEAEHGQAFQQFEEGVYQEMHLCRQGIATLDLVEYIDGFYNLVRRHSHLGGVSPNEFEAVHRKRKSGAC